MFTDLIGRCQTLLSLDAGRIHLGRDPRAHVRGARCDHAHDLRGEVGVIVHELGVEAGQEAELLETGVILGALAGAEPGVGGGVKVGAGAVAGVHSRALK